MVCGITFPFHPWAHPECLKRYLNYSGKWGLLYDKALAGFSNSELLTIVKDPTPQELQQYNQVFIFNDQGQLVQILSSAEYLKKVFP